MSTSVNSVTNHFPSAENGFATTLTSPATGGDTSVMLASVSGYEDGEVVVFVVDPADSAKKQTFTGVIDVPTLTVEQVVWTAGDNVLHSLGATVVDYATATHISMISKGLSVEHNQDGTHSDINATSVDTDTLVVNTGTTLPAGDIVTADIADNAVTSDKTNLSYVHLDGTTFSTFTVTSASSQDTGMAITLPTAGTWFVRAKVRSRISVSGASGRYLRVYLLHNGTTQLDESISGYHAHETTYHVIHNEPMGTIVTTTTNNETVEIWASLSATANVSSASIESDVNGYTTMSAVRIA